MARTIIFIIFGLLCILASMNDALPGVVSLVPASFQVIFTVPNMIFTSLNFFGNAALGIMNIVIYIIILMVIIHAFMNDDSIGKMGGIAILVFSILRIASGAGFIPGSSIFESIAPYVLLISGVLIIYAAFAHDV
jgi:hypothetical protein